MFSKWRLYSNGAAANMKQHEALFNTYMYCACWQMKDRNGKEFPYGKIDKYCMHPSPQNFCVPICIPGADC
jgi:hypothetical protein